MNGSMGLRIIIYLNNKQISDMGSNELLVSLAKMEASLNEVESARKQVESTVNASSELQREVREYVSTVKALCVSLQSREAELRAHKETISREYEEAISSVGLTCTEVIRLFETEVNKTGTGFKTKTEPIIEKYTEQIGKLENHVQGLNALRDEINKTTSEIDYVKETLIQISTELKESQDGQDTVLIDIKLKGDEISNKFDAIVSSEDDIAEKLHSISNNLNESFSLLNKKVDTISSNLSSVEDYSQTIITKISQIESSLELSTKQITTSINDFREASGKSIKINQRIIIVTFILLAILYFIVK